MLVVDAGFLLEALVLQVGSKNRESAAFDYGAISDVLAELVEEQTGQRPLRQVWYDAAWDARPRPEHRSLAALPGVQIRLGWLAKVNGRTVQKAVDTQIVRDLVRMAYRGSADCVVLLAGDGDLVPGVQEASEYGIAVHLWGIATDNPGIKQSAELVAQADSKLDLDIADLASFVRLKPKAAPLPATATDDATDEQEKTPGPASAPEEEAEDESEVVESAVTVASPVSTGAPSLRQLLSPSDYSLFLLRDRLEGVSAQEAGHRYGQRWAEHLDRNVRRRFLETYQRPTVPRRIDLDLLGSAKARQIDVDDETERISARQGFWDALENYEPDSATE